MLAASVSYTIVHRFDFNNFYQNEDANNNGFLFIVSVAPIHYLSLLEISIQNANGNRPSIDCAILLSLLREKQTLSYEVL